MTIGAWIVGDGAGRVKVGEENEETTTFSVVRLEFEMALAKGDEDGAFPEEEWEAGSLEVVVCAFSRLASVFFGGFECDLCDGLSLSLLPSSFVD